MQREEPFHSLFRALFSLMVSALRPVCRGTESPAALPTATPYPSQAIDLIAEKRGSTTLLQARLRFEGFDSRSSDLCCVLPLPRGSVLYGLDLAKAPPPVAAQIGDRREARHVFAEARRAGRPAVLAGEDAPGIFSIEAVLLPSRVAVEVVLSIALPSPAAPAHVDRRLSRLTVRMDAGSQATLMKCGTLVRLGSGRSLDSLLGLDRDGEGGTLQVPASGVLACSDRADGACAVFRGMLASRSLRMMAEWQDGLSIPTLAAPSPDHPVATLSHSLIAVAEFAGRSPARLRVAAA